jgi:hypothetical protein
MMFKGWSLINSHGGLLVAALIFGTEDFFAFSHEPGELALRAGLIQGRLVHGKGAFGVVAAAIEDAPAGAPLQQVAATAFPGAEVGGLVFRGLGDNLAFGAPGEILGELALGIA